ncbi:hypothetical protein FisN_20Lh052 [Fistulifera solaris]|uniref:Uncharacterized protein n=1 Tax=Fistulifera solaris TaxID=1519565 RepID=A0A1Z5JD15_FISSO|nr:hypothetical protein FisN_20Lh052 [Fistulifera solaris]|eukprot:GAX11887.1 hypothetical protein FisN_20Lh052 [Fistulifera solaris]
MRRAFSSWRNQGLSRRLEQRMIGLERRHRSLAVRTLAIQSVDAIQQQWSVLSAPSIALELFDLAEEDDGT